MDSCSIYSTEGERGALSTLVIIEDSSQMDTAAISVLYSFHKDCQLPCNRGGKCPTRVEGICQTYFNRQAKDMLNFLAPRNLKCYTFVRSWPLPLSVTRRSRCIQTVTPEVFIIWATFVPPFKHNLSAFLKPLFYSGELKEQHLSEQQGQQALHSLPPSFHTRDLKANHDLLLGKQYSSEWKQYFRERVLMFFTQKQREDWTHFCQISTQHGTCSLNNTRETETLRLCPGSSLYRFRCVFF